MHGSLGLGSPWTRALFPGPLRAEVEALIPPGYRINVTAVDGKPGPWRLAAFREVTGIEQPVEVETWVTHNPRNAARQMAVRLPLNAMRCSDCGHRLDDMGGCDGCAADREAALIEGGPDAR